MPQSATHPLVAAFIRSRRRWSEQQSRNGTSSYNRWCRWLDAHDLELCEVRSSDCVDYITEREAAVSGSTAHKDWQFLRWLYQWLVREGELGDLPASRVFGPMTNVDPPVVNDPDPERTRACDDDVYLIIMNSFNPRLLADCRNAAIVSLMYRSGLRRSEICRCDIERMDVGDIHPWLEVLGKNGEWRRVPIAHETAVWLERYLRRLGHDRPSGPGAPLFVATYNGSRASGGRLKVQAITDMLKRRCDRLGVHVSSHMFRRGMAIESKRRGLNDTTIMAVGGWKSTRMLDRYQKSERQELAAAEFHAADTTAMPQRAVRRRTGRLRAV